MLIYTLIESILEENYDLKVTNENVGIFSSFEKAYSKYMEISKNKNKCEYYYFIEEWEVDGQRKNIHRY